MTNISKATEPTIIIGPDRQTATLVLPAGLGPEATSAMALLAMARERGIDVTPEVERALSEAEAVYAASGGPAERVIARAVPAKPGADATIEWAEGCDPTAPDTPQDGKDDDDPVCFYNVRTFVRVARGDRVATVRPATGGEDGRDVCGGTISTTPGKPLSFTFDKSLSLDPEGPLVAERDGVLKIEGRTVRVDPVLEIAGTVDFSTGNIEFDGDIHIRNDIRDHFTVQTSKSVTVDGLIDASHIRCGENLHVRRGVAGRGVGTLRVGGDAEVGYLAQVGVHVGGDLRFAQEIVQSEVRVGGDLVSDSGRVIGGEARVAGNVSIAQLGSPGESPTTLAIGPVQEAESEAVVRLRATLKKLRAEADTLRSASQHRTPAAAERLTELEFEIADAEQSLQASGSAPPAPVRLDSVVEVSRMIHGRVTLLIGGQTVVFRDSLKGPVRIWAEGSEVMHQIGDGSPAPISGLPGVVSRRAA